MPRIPWFFAVSLVPKGSMVRGQPDVSIAWQELFALVVAGPFGEHFLRISVFYFPVTTSLL